eukprot:scaffold29523_cov69-Phaeocystis_antarctica.AAC.4
MAAQTRSRRWHNTRVPRVILGILARGNFSLWGHRRYFGDARYFKEGRAEPGLSQVSAHAISRIGKSEKRSHPLHTPSCMPQASTANSEQR